MGNLFASIGAAADSLRAFEQTLSVAGNNITNAQTPGYVRQRMALSARPLQLDSGLPGGVSASGLVTTRRAYLENSVRMQVSREGYSAQQTFNFQQVEPVFDISAASGVAGALDGLQRAFSQWSVTPNDQPSRQNVLRRAQDVAHAFNFTAQALSNAAANADNELVQSVNAVNRIGRMLQNFNAELRSDARKLDDPGLDAQVHAALEELAEYVDFTVIRPGDGTFSVYLGGQTPLALGGSLYPVSVEFGTGLPVIRDPEGADITGQFTAGKIRALTDFRTGFLVDTVNELNFLAGQVADAVNIQLQAGVDLNGQPPVLDLFAYDSAGGAAATLRLTGITAEELSAAAPEAPGGNANALALAGLFTSRAVNNFTFTQYFGEIAGRVGKALSIARSDRQTQSQLVAQTKSLRDEASGVSLDEEAANLIVFQRAYQAAAQLIRTLDEMTETMINIKR